MKFVRYDLDYDEICFKEVHWSARRDPFFFSILGQQRRLIFCATDLPAWPRKIAVSCPSRRWTKKNAPNAQLIAA